MKIILAFSGSNSSQSINQCLIHDIADKVSQHYINIIDLNNYPLPMYSLDTEANGIPANVHELKNIMNQHDALIIASPEHNGSMPAFFKNTIDWLSRIVEPGQPFFGDNRKPVLLLSTSPGQNGGATNLTTMSTLMPWWGGDVKATYSVGSYYDKFKNGQFDSETDQALSSLITLFEEQL